MNGPLYPLLYEYALPYRGLRVPARADVLVGLSVGVLSGVGMARLLGRLDGARRGLSIAVGVGLALVACAEDRAAPPLRAVHPPSQWHRWLATLGNSPVFEWPVATPERLDINDDARYMYTRRRTGSPS